MKNKYVVALGFFDGVHAAHKELFRLAKNEAQRLGCSTAAIIFDRRPRDVVAGTGTELINTAEDRVRIIKDLCGIEETISIAFTKEFMLKKWDLFIKELVEGYDACAFVAGYDFRFGHMGEGNAEKLKKLCRELKLGCIIADEMKIDGVTVSSTHIRELIRDGEMEKAARFLGHRHILTGVVTEGKKLGRTIGIPTANLLIPDGIITPRFGVYETEITLPTGEKKKAVTNVGVRPTVSGENTVTVESYILDFSGDLYGREIIAEYVRFLRPEQKFGGLAELKAGIERDIDRVLRGI